MRFYVRYSEYQYEGKTEMACFDTIKEVLAFVNSQSGNPDFDFTVIRGELVEFEPAATVTAWREKNARS